MHEQARRLREEAGRLRDQAMADADPAARFQADDQDWDQPVGAGWGLGSAGAGWTDWPGRRGWDDWTRMRGRGWAGALDFGTLRDLERLALQFTSELRRLAMQSSFVGENVISDLRTILEDALERIKSEIFGPAQPPRESGDEPAKQD